MDLRRLKRPFRAALAGSLGAAIDLALLLVLVALGLSAVVATICGAAVGSTVNFVTAKYWAFRDPDARIATQGGLFAAQTSVWIVLCAVVVHALVAVARAPVLLARLVADVVVFVVWGYPAQKWIFSTRSSRT